MVETVFKTIKTELIWRTSYTTREQANKAIGEYIEGFYNPRRRHSSLGYKSPAAFETAFHATIRQSNRPSTDTGEVQGDDNCRNDGCETELHADAVDHLAGQQMFV